MNKRIVLILMIHIAVVLWIANGWQKELLNVSFEGDMLETDTGKYEPDLFGNGIYIDSSAGAVEKYVSTPKMNLNRGTYLITLEYKAEAEGQTYGVSSDQPGYRIITGLEKRVLRPEKETECFYIWLDNDASGYQISTSYNGAGYFLVKNITVSQTNAFFMMRAFLGLCLIALIDGIIVFRKKGLFRNFTAEDKTVCVTMALTTIVASIPMFSYYLLTGHDLPFHLLRIEGIKDALLSGQFPVRIQPGWFNGYGYAASIFYGDIFLYIPAFLRALGFPLQTVYKVFVIIVNLMTCAGAYYCFYKICGRKYAALVGSVLYTLAPYRLGNIYIRAAAGEYTAAVFLPFIAAGLYLALKKEADRQSLLQSVLLMVIGFSGIIQSHMITCEMAAFFTILVCFIYIKRIFVDGRWKVLLAGAFITTGINLWFIIPFLDYSMSGRFQVVQAGAVPKIQTSCAFVSQLFDVFPNGSGSAYTVYERLQDNTEMPLTVGFILMWSIGGFLLYCINEKGEETERKLGKICILLAGLALWMATIIFPWDFLAEFGTITATLIRTLQYGWRMLSIASLLLSVMVTCLISMLIKKFGDKCVIIIGTYCVAGLVLGGWMTSAFMRDGTEEIYRDRSEVNEEYVSMLEYVPDGTDRGKFVETMPVAGADVAIYDYGNDRGRITIECENFGMTEGEILLPVLNYDGYEARNSDGEELVVLDGDNNRIRLIVPAGYKGDISVSFVEPLLWRSAEIISLIFLAVMVWAFFNRHNVTKLLNVCEKRRLSDK